MSGIDNWGRVAQQGRDNIETHHGGGVSHPEYNSIVVRVNYQLVVSRHASPETNTTRQLSSSTLVRTLPDDSTTEMLNAILPLANNKANNTPTNETDETNCCTML